MPIDGEHRKPVNERPAVEHRMPWRRRAVRLLGDAVCESAAHELVRTISGASQPGIPGPCMNEATEHEAESGRVLCREEYVGNTHRQAPVSRSTALPLRSGAHR